MTERWLTIDELADLLGKKRSWVRDQVTARQLPHHRLGQQVRFTPGDVEAIETQTAEPVAPAVPALAPIRRTHPPASAA